MKKIEPEAIMGKRVGYIEQDDTTLRLGFMDGTALEVSAKCSSGDFFVDLIRESPETFWDQFNYKEVE